MLTRRILIILLLFISLITGIKYFYLYNGLYNNTGNINFLIEPEGKKLNQGIYVVYPLDGSACDSCIYNLCLILKKYYGGKINLLIPVAMPDNKFKNSNIVNTIKYKSINPMLYKKVFFIGRDNSIKFLCNISYLIAGKRQDIKYIIYSYKSDL